VHAVILTLIGFAFIATGKEAQKVRMVHFDRPKS